MERLIDEAQYVLRALYQTRDEVSANPNSFAPDAAERIDEAIAHMHDVLRSARASVAFQSVPQEPKAGVIGLVKLSRAYGVISRTTP